MKRGRPSADDVSGQVARPEGGRCTPGEAAERSLREERQQLLEQARREAESRERYIERLSTLFRVTMAVLKEATVEGLLREIGRAHV